MRNNKKGLNRELIILYGTISAMIGLGVLFFMLFSFNITISASNSGLIIAAYSAFSAILWVFLLFRNC